RRAGSGEGSGARTSHRRIAGVSVRVSDNGATSTVDITRRQFVKGGVAAFTVTFSAPEFLCDLARAQGSQTRNLVVLYLSGVNDSLSMLIPYSDSSYYSRRPTLAVPATNVLLLGSDASL